MRTAEDSRQRWATLFSHCRCGSLEVLAQKLKSGEHGSLCEDTLRSVCWKAFLVHKNLDRESWPVQLLDRRGAYTALKEHFLKYIEHPDDLPSAADPLAEDDSSPWQSLRQDEETRAEIHQDVERCLQDNYFFREPTTKRRMIDILFVFVKLNPDLGYRQGMHELLAPILWVIWQDAIENGSGAEDLSADDSLLFQTLNSEYMEHDAFAIFCAIMQSAKLFYEHDNMKKSDPSQPHVSSIIIQSQHIHQELLGKVDPELSAHLQSIEILPQIYLTRWLRLFFGREFPFQGILSMWDFLFTDLRPELIELVCVSMLLRIRWELLLSDYSAALALLLKYPSTEPHKPEGFVLDALFLEENMTLDGGDLLISKYSGKSPDFTAQAVRSRANFPSLHRRNARSRDPSSQASEQSSPSRSPLGITQRRLDSIFQDMSEGIHRRTESWGVAKAVRGAMVEARRNIQAVHSSPSAPGLLLDNAHASRFPIPPTLEAAASQELSLKVAALENRNRDLADILEDALKGLRACHQAKSGSLSSADLGQSLEKIGLVQTLLQDSTIPIPALMRGEAIKKSDLTENSASEKENVKEPRKGDLPEATDPKPVPSPSLPKKKELLKPMPIRPSPRAPLAESSFSWMLGENDRRSAFAPCATSPPELQRKQDVRAKSGPLFGDQRGEAKHDLGEDDHDVLVLDQLRGATKE